MGKIIAVAQHKGGTGKTTTCLNLGASLCDTGKTVLIIDLDPQASLTVSVGINPLQVKKSIHHVLVDPNSDIKDTIIQLPTLNLSVVPSHMDLAMVESELAGKIGREKVLFKKLAAIKDDFDYIFIDCPPTLGLLVVNALASADSVLIPIQCEPLTFYGVKHLLQIINLIREEVNPPLKIEGILRTMYDRRTKLSEEVSESIMQTFGDLVFSTIIYRHIKFAEGPVHEMPINFYASRSPGALEYRELAKELLTHETKKA
ncbi:MAG: AAA family ATPase [Dehalococcoidia bacterium]|nr:AAA family ATPase [Dehalococcoidia bacterium]MDZ4247544.1 AAA family ATPase [Dehalococcoidia bacterium]